MQGEAGETFVIIDPVQMHNEAMIENRECKLKWEQYIRSEMLTGRQYSLATRLLFTYPVKQKTSVLLHQAFPILKYATMVEVDSGFVPRRGQFTALGNVDLQLCTAFDLEQHGRVFLLGVSCLPSTLSAKDCSLKIGALVPSDTNELTLSMINNGNPNDIYIFMVTLVVPFTGCRLCGACHDSTDTRTHMLKCGRCSKALQFPVWYCDKECQRLDYPRHKRRDGCGVAKK